MTEAIARMARNGFGPVRRGSRATWQLLDQPTIAGRFGSGMPSCTNKRPASAPPPLANHGLEVGCLRPLPATADQAAEIGMVHGTARRCADLRHPVEASFVARGGPSCGVTMAVRLSAFSFPAAA